MDASNAESASWFPPEEQECIWMSAGVLSYKLCNRNMECEDCPLHRALYDGGSEADKNESAENKP